MFKMVADQEKRKENELVKARSKASVGYNASLQYNSLVYQEMSFL